MSQRREALWEYLRGALWVLPCAAFGVALVLGSVLAKVNVPNSSPLHRLVFQGTTDDARALLIGIASTMITVIALVLGLTVVALQLSSTQFSPRLLRNFLRDRPSQLVLSAFVATFAYSAAGLYTVGVSGGARSASFPRLAVSGAILLLFLSLLALVYEIHHVAHSMQIDDIMHRVEVNTIRVVRDVRRVGGDAGCPPVPHGAAPIRAGRSGYVQTIHPEPLVAVAGQLGISIAVNCRVGDHVVAGAPLAWAWDGSGEPPPELPGVVVAVDESVRVGFERTLEQDAAFGVRQLVDVASKALSPAVNDPYTGVQAIDHLGVILAAIAEGDHGTSTYPTAALTTVVVPGHSFADYLNLAVAQIRRFGSREPAVLLELIKLLSTTAYCTDDPGRRAEIGHQLDLLLADADRDVTQSADLVELHAAADGLRSLLTPSTSRPVTREGDVSRQ